MNKARKLLKGVLRSRARKFAKSILREFGGLCAWCDREIIRSGEVVGPIVSKTENSITWVQDGQVVVSILATMDHLTPISEGGLSKRWNLVPACRTCNGKRQHRDHFKRFLVRETVWQLRAKILRDKSPDLESILVR